jgi:hypothetical protein
MTNTLLIIEIKTPVTRLLGSEYRGGVFPLSAELQGAIAQALRYRQSLSRSFDAITSEIEQRIILGEPRCIIFAGHSSELDSIAKKECFELQRERLSGVVIVTFDELFAKLSILIELLSGNSGSVREK